METRNVIFVVLNRIKRHGVQKIGQAVCGCPAFAIRASRRSSIRSSQCGCPEREAGDRVRYDPALEILPSKWPRAWHDTRDRPRLLHAGRQRVVIQHCVVPVVSSGSLALRRSPHVIFVLLLEQSVLSGKTSGHGPGQLRSNMNTGNGAYLPYAIAGPNTPCRHAQQPRLNANSDFTKARAEHLWLTMCDRETRMCSFHFAGDSIGRAS